MIQLGFPPCRVDLITSIDGVDERDAFAETSMGIYGDVPVPFLNRGALLSNKRATGRPKDLADVESLGGT